MLDNQRLTHGAESQAARIVKHFRTIHDENFFTILLAPARLFKYAIRTMKMRITNEGDDDTNLWVVVCGREELFVSRIYGEALKFVVDNGGELY